MKSHRLGYLVLRLALGLNILLHGLVRLGPNYENFVAATAAPFTQTPLPSALAFGMARLIPVAEAAVGLFLFVGCFTQAALLLGSGLMMVLLAGVCLLQKWDIAGLQMVYIAFYGFLLYRMQDNHYSLDKKLRPGRFLPEMAAETQ